jgi:NTE family protein
MPEISQLVQRTPASPAGKKPAAGLCLSGGGFRAMTFHIGALRRLYEVGALQHLERISSVSGGSIAAGHLAMKWPKLTESPNDLDVFIKEVQKPLFDFGGRRVDVSAGLRGLVTPGRSVADTVASVYKKRLFKDATLGDLPDHPHFVFCSTNMGSGSVVRFGKHYTSDYRIGKRDGLKLPLARVVAASAAFPPFLSPMVIKLDEKEALTEQFELQPGDEPPVLAGVEPYARRLQLSDGGVYDNLGMQPLDQYHTILVSDGGGPFKYAPRVQKNWFGHIIRSWKVTDNQVRALRRGGFVDELEGQRRFGAFWGIQTQYSDYPTTVLDVDDGWCTTLMNISTRLWRIDKTRRKQLVNWGYSVCDAALRSYWTPDIGAPSLPFPEAPLDKPPAG